MSDNSELIGLVQSLHERIDDLYFLTLGGGKESRLVETVPMWRKGDCDSTCEFTDTPMPAKKRVKVGKLKVHPGVQAWVGENNIEDIEECDPSDVPSDYLRVAPTTRLRSKYIPTQRIQWTTDQLPHMERAVLSMVATDIGLTASCKMVHPDVDWRYEDVQWIRDAVLLLFEAEDKVAAAKKLKFKTEHNKLIIWDRKEKTGGNAKAPKSKKTAKKAATKKK